MFLDRTVRVSPRWVIYTPDKRNLFIFCVSIIFGMAVWQYNLALKYSYPILMALTALGLCVSG